jgi:hypothetical protein
MAKEVANMVIKIHTVLLHPCITKHYSDSIWCLVFSA